MEIRHLRYFVAVAECGGFARAANRLNVTQPALSRQVRDLEQELSVTLFDRTPRGVRLTYPGERFLEATQQLLADLEHAKSMARDAQTGKVGALTIGIVESFSWHPAVTRAIRAFRNQNPDVALTVVVMNSADQIAALRDHRLSAGLVMNFPRTEKEFDVITILTDRLVLGVPDMSPFAKRPPERLAELVGQDLFWIPRKINPSHFDQVILACHNGGLMPRMFVGGITDSANLSLVASGLGCTFVTSEARWRKPANVVIVPVNDLKVMVTLDFVWHQSNRQQALANFVQSLLFHKSVRDFDKQ